MSTREKNLTSKGAQYRAELANRKAAAEKRSENKQLNAQIEDLADLMKNTDMRVSGPAPGQMDLEQGGKRRRRKTHKRRGGKRKTHRKH